MSYYTEMMEQDRRWHEQQRTRLSALHDAPNKRFMWLVFEAGGMRNLVAIKTTLHEAKTFSGAQALDGSRIEWYTQDNNHFYGWVVVGGETLQQAQAQRPYIYRIVRVEVMP